MKPCCEPMAEHVSNLGQRLFSVYLPSKDAPLMQSVPHIIFRAYDEGAEVQISASVPVSIEGTMGFRFCPWCGSLLKQ